MTRDHPEGVAGATDAAPRIASSPPASVEGRNVAVLVVHHVLLRVGWIFKTETVLLPAFLDSIAGAGWVRGLLPTLSRFGQSLPPLLVSDRIRGVAEKRHALFSTTASMGVSFWLIAAIASLAARSNHAWLSFAFLLVYFVFFSLTGTSQVAFGTVQGKLIRATSRGRLMSIGSVVGSTSSILCAWFFLGAWLDRPGGGFATIFFFSGCGFFAAGLAALLLRETPDPRSSSRRATGTVLREAWRTLRDDARFRRSALVATCVLSSFLLFPHFQALGRARLGTTAGDLLYWVIAQNAGAGVLGFVVGAIADRRGTRLAIRVAAFIGALAPWVALTHAWAGYGASYWLTFVVLGVIPVTQRLIENHVLEIVDREHHPRYLSTMKLVFAIPFLASPLVGVAVDAFGFEPVFGGVATVVLIGGLLTFRMSEPRHETGGET